jgi:hypothetical protein
MPSWNRRDLFAIIFLSSLSGIMTMVVNAGYSKIAFVVLFSSAVLLFDEQMPEWATTWRQKFFGIVLMGIFLSPLFDRADRWRSAVKTEEKK